MTKTTPEFYTTHKHFTTSQARAAGITRKQLRKNKDVVCLGSFPRNTGRVLAAPPKECIWAYSPELASLINESEKLHKKGKPSSEIIKVRDEIEILLQGILGFSPTPLEEKENDGNEEESSDEEVSS